MSLEPNIAQPGSVIINATLSGTTTLPGGAINSDGTFAFGGTQANVFSPIPDLSIVSNNSINRIELAGYGASNLNFITFKSAGGTPTSPTATSANTTLSTVQNYGFDGTVFAAQSVVLCTATENWTGSARGTTLQFYGTPTGSTTLTRVLDVAGGGIGIKLTGFNAPQAMLHIGMTAATARSYNAFTDTSNSSWAYVGDWGKTANVATFGTDQNGTGTARGIQLTTGGTVALQINTSQLLAFGPGAAFTSSFPAIKRSSTIAQFRLGDDSDYAPVEGSLIRTAKAFTVATLPPAGTAGQRAYVTNATATTFLTIVAGGGTNVVPVFDDGTNWRIG